MKSPQVKIHFNNESSNFVSTVILSSLPGKRMTKGIYWSVLVVLVAMALSACKESGKTSNPVAVNFPVNQTIAAELISKGVPADAAQFFAAAKVETTSPDDTTIVCQQTFPNGATRDITIRIDPNRQYTPTADEIAHTTPGSIPIYAFQYSYNALPDNSTEIIKMNYYVAKAGLPKGTAKKVQISDPSTNQTRAMALYKIAVGAGENDGAGISYEEVAKKGADAYISSLLEYAKDQKIKIGPLGSIYALASALSDITGALDVSQQNTAWLMELNSLENCAANPTNQVAKSDPNYSMNTVAKIQAARAELQEVNAVRFLNIMTETGAGINPVTAILSVGLKPAFQWNEQTLKNYSESTIMREARLAVVPCDTTAFDGNIDVLWDCTTTIADQVDHEVVHTQTKVKWVFDPTQMLYVSQGSFIFDYKLTSTAGGKTCTDTKSAAGNIGATGRLTIINDPAGQKLLGYGYLARGSINTNVTASYSCAGTSRLEPYTITWLPPIKGYLGTGGSIEGEMVNPSCVGSSSSGTETVKWSFSVPPAN
jgi:hypothetical protein